MREAESVKREKEQGLRDARSTHSSIPLNNSVIPLVVGGNPSLE